MESPKPLRSRAELSPGSGRRPVLDFVRRWFQGLADGRLAVAQRVDWGLVVALAIGLIAATPFLARPGLPHQTDAELHVYRTAELNHITSAGVRYPRWASNLYLGYGYPIFNYYAPLTYHLGSVFARALPGPGIVAGTKAVFVLGLLLASVGAYLLGRDLFDPAGGVLASASFVLSPYVQFIDPHARGALAEHFAICLLPLTFYFFQALMRKARPILLLGSVLSLSAVVFSHNLLGLASGALLAAYWAWRFLVGPRAQRLASLWAPLAFALAAGLIAFFWLPALAERGAVKLEVIGPGHFDFREHFLGLGELLAPSRLLDWGATGPRFRHNLGLAQWAFAVPALAVLVRQLRQVRAGEPRWDIVFFLAGALGITFLMLSPSAVVWTFVPAMPYLQFPWRLLGPANLMLAVCAASATTLLPRRPWRRPVLAGSLALFLLTGLPLLYPPPWPADFGGTSPLDIIRWEMESQALGTTSTGDFLPTTVDMIPSVAESLIASYATEGPIDKVNRSTLPEGAEVTVLDHGPNHDRFRVVTPERFVLRLYTFHFPGWRAYVDGREAEIELARPEGFITLWVPQGEHTVTLRFEDTPVRELGSVVSAGTLVLFLGTFLVWSARSPGTKSKTKSPLQLSIRETAWLGGALMLILVFKFAVVDPLDWLHIRSSPGEAIPAQHKLRTNFEGKVELLGYDLPRTRVRAGETFSLVLYWHALAPMEKNYQSFVHLAEPLDRVWGQEDHLNPGGLPTRRWPLDKYVWDEYDIQVRPETPPGEYRVNVGLYLRSEGYRLKRWDRGGREIGDSRVIGSITVTE